MLRSYRLIYEAKAEKIPKWKTINKNDLINLYLKYESDPVYAEAYLSAIICRYWGLIDKYYAQSCHSVPVEEVYDWLIRAVLYALKHRKWTDPENKLYNDPAGPDKVINRCMLSSRRIFYQASNYDKRAANYGASSLEKLSEDCGDALMPEITTSYENVEDCAENLIKDYFKRGKFFTAFFIDGIANYESFDKKNPRKEYDFNSKKLMRHLNQLDQKYAESFAERFDFDLEIVTNAVAEMRSLTRIKMHNRMRYSTERLKKNKALLEAKC